MTTNQKSKHTPGPWKAFMGEHAPFVSSMEGDKNSICEIYKNINGEHVANALLIAAAPELLEAIKDLLSRSYLVPNSDLDSEFRELYKLVEKAEGGQS